ncbi:MAG: ACT domain-containing protein [Planctomycetes bacterium]|nr:ACT domain-containing protein [Planctomycetota bacterium]
MQVPQISVFLENKTGRMADVTEILAQNDINIIALSVADTSEFGILRLIVNKPEEAYKMLKAAGFTAMTNFVIAVEVADEPGGLAKILRLLSDAVLNVEYMYAFVEPSTGRAALIFRFEKETEAVRTLQAGGIAILQKIDVFKD